MGNKKIITSEELEDKYIGKKGSPERNEFEVESALALIKEAVIELRRKSGISKAELAKRMGVSKSSVSRYENSDTHNNITIATLIRMVNAMGGKLKIVISKEDYREINI